MKEVHKFVPGTAVLEVKVKAVPVLHDVCAVFVRAMLENELLQKEEGTFVSHFLPCLNNSVPCVLGPCPLADVTLQILHGKLHDEHLLQHGSGEHLSWSQEWGKACA